MGILNITPDSFYPGSRFTDPVAILKQVETMLVEGADFIDVGGYSTRPGADVISVEEEHGRVITAIKAIRKEFPESHLSIDTFRSEIAKGALEEGANLINDISGGESDPMMFRTAAAYGVPYILMHMQGTPKTMNQFTDYENLIKEMLDYFHKKMDQLKQVGVKDVIVDPGFGFAKTVDQNFELLNNLQQFQVLGKPVLVGLSRKSMIWRTLETTAEFALNGTTVLHTISLLKGASLLRVHDVKAAREAITLTSRF